MHLEMIKEQMKNREKAASCLKKSALKKAGQETESTPEEFDVWFLKGHVYNEKKNCTKKIKEI